MTARETVVRMLSYLRLEQRGIPYGGDTAYNDPFPDVLDSINAALQKMAVIGPLFAAKTQRSAYFRAPSTLAVSALVNGAKTATGAFPAWAAGCWVQLPGDDNMNRITSVTGITAGTGTGAILQFPHLSASTSGTATINVDTVELDSDIITVLEPVRIRNSVCRLRAAASRDDLVGWGCQPNTRETGYFIEAATSNGEVKLRMMLSGYVASDTVIEFQARTSLGFITTDDIYAAMTPDTDPGVLIPVPAQFIESIFLPLAMGVFFTKATITNYDVPSLRNEDATALIRQQEVTAMQMLAEMQPQGNKPVRMMPALSTSANRSGWRNGWGYGGYRR